MKEHSAPDWVCRAAVSFFGLACLALCVFSIASSIQKFFSLDETDIATRSHMINMFGPTGPEIYFGKGNGEAIPHPPMYDYALALVFRLFGETETAARGFGVLCFILVGVVMALIVRHLLKDNDAFFRRTTVTAALLIYAVNPLLIQHAMLVDADATFTFLFVNLFVYFFIRFEQKKEAAWVRSRLGLAPFFALVCLSKEVTPVWLAAGVVAYRLLGREWKKMAADFFLVLVSGTALAWGLWLLFCHFTGIYVMIFLKQQYAFRISHMGGHAHFVKKLIDSIPLISRWPVYWMSGPFFILLLLCLFLRGIHFFKTRKPGPEDLCFLTALAVWGPYFFIKPSIDMMKYQHPVYPLFIAGMTSCLARLVAPNEEAWRKSWRERPWLLLAIIFLAAETGFYYYGLGDYILALVTRAGDGRWVRFCGLYWWPVLSALAGAGIYSLFRKRLSLRAVALVCLFFIIPINGALDWRQTASYTTAESWLNYGEKGLRETVVYLSTRLSPETPCVLRKDLTYYLKLRYGIPLSKVIDPVYVFRDKDLLQAVRNFMEKDKPNYVVLDPVVMMSNPFLAVLQKKVFRSYVIDRREGHFVILRHRDARNDGTPSL